MRARSEGPRGCTLEPGHSRAGETLSLTEQFIPTLFGDPSLRAHMRSHSVQDDKGLAVTRETPGNAFVILSPNAHQTESRSRAATRFTRELFSGHGHLRLLPRTRHRRAG